MKHYIIGILVAILLLSPCQGFGDKPSQKEILSWQQLAKQGNADAQCNLGVIYDTAQGVPQDYAEALKWYRLAADQRLSTASG